MVIVVGVLCTVTPSKVALTNKVPPPGEEPAVNVTEDPVAELSVPNPLVNNQE
jgi:hypothetical protein